MVTDNSCRCDFANTNSRVEAQGEPGAQEVRNDRAWSVYTRVQHKLTGRSDTIEFLYRGSFASSL
jgi:hypothetical protein